jgi:STE24 endopeptidase
LKEWIIDQIKELLLLLIIGGVILEVIYYVLRISPTNWWIWAASFLLFFNVLLANLAPVLLFPLFYKFTPLPDEYQSLKTRLLELAKKSNVKVSDVYQFDMSRKTKAANAALTGLGNTRRIILGDTLLKEFTADEIETVLAHELGHQVHKDIVLGIIIQSLITLIGFYFVSLFMNWGVHYFGFKEPSDIAAMPLFALILILYGIITMPVSNAYSRWRERLADEYALKLTHNGQAFASALTRLANQNLADANPEGWVEFLLYSHPALSKRIRLATEYNQTNTKIIT